MLISIKKLNKNRKVLLIISAICSFQSWSANWIWNHKFFRRFSKKIFKRFVSWKKGFIRDAMTWCVLSHFLVKGRYFMISVMHSLTFVGGWCNYGRKVGRVSIQFLRLHSSKNWSCFNTTLIVLYERTSNINMFHNIYSIEFSAVKLVNTGWGDDNFITREKKRIWAKFGISISRGV